MEDRYNLLETFENNDVVLFDTCAFNPPTRPRFEDRRRASVHERKEVLSDKNVYLNYLIELAKSYRFYTISHVRDEVLKGLNYKAFREETKKMSSNHKENSIPLGLVKRENKKLRKLLNIIEENNQIIDTNGKLPAQYQLSHSRHLPSKRDSKLSDVDFHIIITGLNFAYNGANVCLISSDIGMFRAYHEIIKQENPDGKLTFKIHEKEIYHKVMGGN